jgi:hypothetical protein
VVLAATAAVPMPPPLAAAAVSGVAASSVLPMIPPLPTLASLLFGGVALGVALDRLAFYDRHDGHDGRRGGGWHATGGSRSLALLLLQSCGSGPCHATTATRRVDLRPPATWVWQPHCAH